MVCGYQLLAGMLWGEVGDGGVFMGGAPCAVRQRRWFGWCAHAARRVADAGAQAVITGNVGPKAFNALRASGVDVYLTHVGTVEMMVERLMTGRLERSTRASRAGYAGDDPVSY